MKENQKKVDGSFRRHIYTRVLVGVVSLSISGSVSLSYGLYLKGYMYVCWYVGCSSLHVYKIAKNNVCLELNIDNDYYWLLPKC